MGNVTGSMDNCTLPCVVAYGRGQSVWNVRLALGCVKRMIGIVGCDEWVKLVSVEKGEYFEAMISEYRGFLN